MNRLSKEEFASKYGSIASVPASTEKSVTQKLSSGLDTVFGGGQLGNVFGTEIARGTFGKTLQKMWTGRELSQEESKSITQDVTGKQILGDIGKIGLTLATAGGLGAGGGVLAQASKSAVLGAGFGATQGMKENQNVGDIAQNALIGGAIGGAIPPTFAGAKFLGGKAVDVGRNIVGATKTVAELTDDAIRGVSRIPSNIGTNIAERQATLQKINALPTETAKIAVRDGIDIKDVNTLINIPKEQKKLLKPLLESVKKFSEGVSKQRPEEIVGKPILTRVKQLETQRVKIGQKLGDVADNLGIVTKDDVFNPILSALKKTKGLEGLTVNKNGTLNFSRTTLATEANKTARNQIQSFFTRATSWGKAKQKHLLRQEIFEILGGKKRSLSQITDTEEKALEAIRKGLSDTLENKNPLYKSLSNEYRKIVQPLSELRRFMKTIPDAQGEDILDMQAGLLARRLTSNAPSNPQLRNILRKLDIATKVKGTTSLNIESLQDFYNVLNRYYDISAPTGFQGQIKNAIPSDITGKIMQTIGKVAGETDAVRQKALENLIEDLIR